MYILYYTYMFVCKCLQSPNDQVVFLRITLGIFPNKALPVAVRPAWITCHGSEIGHWKIRHGMNWIPKQPQNGQENDGFNAFKMENDDFYHQYSSTIKLHKNHQKMEN